MNIIGVVPFKYESTRLPLKNFQKISHKEKAPNLWQATYQLLKNDNRISEIFFALDENIITKNAVHEWGIINNVFQEEIDYPKGNTLGQKLSYFLMFLEFNNRLKGVDYVIVPQVDIWPKFSSDITDMIDVAQKTQVDYIVSCHDEKQIGAWRMIKVPLCQEVLGQTLGFCEMGLERVDIHYQKDLEAAQFYYDNCKGEF